MPVGAPGKAHDDENLVSQHGSSRTRPRPRVGLELLNLLDEVGEARQPRQLVEVWSDELAALHLGPH